MISVLAKHQNDVTVFVRIEGAALFAPKGSDIVCASVSILALNTLNSLKAVAGLDVKPVMMDHLIEFSLPSVGQSVEVKTLVASMLLGLRMLGEKYPKNIEYKNMII